MKMSMYEGENVCVAMHDDAVYVCIDHEHVCTVSLGTRTLPLNPPHISGSAFL